MSRRLFPILFFCLVILSGMPVRAQTPAPQQVRVGLYEREPLCRIKDGQYSGLTVDILNFVAGQEKWHLRFVPGTLEEGIDRLNRGEIDVLANVPYARDSQLRFASQSITSTWGEVYVPEGAALQSLLDLDGKAVGVIRDDEHGAAIRALAQQMNLNLTFAEFADSDALFAGLKQKYIDAAVADRLHEVIHTPPSSIQVSPIIFNPIEYRFAAAPQGDRSLLDILDLHLKALKNDPASFYSATVSEWNHNNGDRQFMSTLKRGLILAGFLLLLFLMVNIVLRRQVRLKTAELQMRYKELETEVAMRRQAEAERLLLSTAINQSADSILITGTDGIIQYFNPAYLAMAEISREQAMGSKNWIMERIQQNDPALAQAKDSLEKGIPWTGHLTFKRSRGAIGEIEATLSPVRNDQGELTHYVIACHDITEAIHMEEQLRQAQKLEAIGTLAGGIAHDFNNLLFPILGHIEILQEEVAGNQAIEDRLSRVQQAALRGKDLVAQILAFSRQRPMQVAAIPIRSVVKEALKLLRASLPATIEIRTHFDEEIISVMADPTQIHQIVMNLCTNAYHAMADGAGVLGIELSSAIISAETAPLKLGLAPGRYVRLAISDTGCGMPPEVTQRIFEPFFTTKPAGKGTGLGLSVVHGIVEQLKGRISVYSEPGKGTTFSIYLPAIESNPAKTKVHGREVLPGGTERLLVVDDETFVAEVISDMLTRLGYQVVSFTNSKNAFDAFVATPEKFDLVITDQTMPELTGEQLALEILKIRNNIPIVLCSGFSEIINHEKAQSIGIAAFVMKPVIYRDLAAIIRRSLDENPSKSQTATESLEVS